jgi:hypothetical protein
MQASLTLQRALHAALAADVALGERALTIHDGPPADSRLPYLTIGADQLREWGWKGGGGWEHRFSVSLWETRAGAGRVKAVLADVERVVLGMPRRFEGLRIVTLNLVAASVKAPARMLTQGTIEFRARSLMED